MCISISPRCLGESGRTIRFQLRVRFFGIVRSLHRAVPSRLWKNRPELSQLTPKRPSLGTVGHPQTLRPRGSKNQRRLGKASHYSSAPAQGQPQTSTPIPASTPSSKAPTPSPLYPIHLLLHHLHENPLHRRQHRHRCHSAYPQVLCWH